MLVVATLLALLFIQAEAQNQAPLDTLLKKFNHYRTTHLPEKIYLHLDQETYFTGEVLWFKLYLLDGVLHKPSDVSKVAYVELLDQNNKPVVQAKIDVDHGMGEGSLFLPATLDGAYYSIRAYTNWMKNNGPDFYYHKTIKIINAFRRAQEDASSPSKPDAQFFPEGGYLVAGLESTVAFRVIDANGKGLAFDGILRNQDSDTIARFSPSQFGIGTFSFTPQASHRYHAILTDKQGRQSSYDLPEVKAKGWVMHLSDKGSSVEISVTSSDGQQERLYLFVHARNIISHASMAVFNNGRVSVSLPKSDLQEGISHITIFDANLQPICERLLFTPVKQRAVIDAEVSQTAYGIRRKVVVDLTASDPSGKPLPANLSLSVYRDDSLQQQSPGSILSYLWLSSDLRGTIESPLAYLNDNDETRAAVDNLMLTHGWRRFAWPDILQREKELAFAPEFHGHIIRGMVTSTSGEPKAGARTYVSAPGRDIQLYASFSNAMGQVKFEMKDFYGPRKIIAQTNSAIDSTSQITILSPFSDQFTARKFPPFSVTPALEQEIISRSVALQVQDVFYQERNSRFDKSPGDTTSFYGKPDATYLLDDYTRFPVMEEVMREYVPQVLVRKRKGKFHFMVLDNVNKTVFDEDPMVLLDGLPVFDVDDIMDFDPLLVRKLEIMTRRYYLGVVSMPGIVSYTTYTGDLAGFPLDPRAVTLDYDGLQLRREFYLPRYESEKVRDSRLPDQRVLLYWAPDIVCDRDGKYHAEFYTSDVPGTYRLVAEGITTDGLAGSGTTTFTVQRFDN